MRFIPAAETSRGVSIGRRGSGSRRRRAEGPDRLRSGGFEEPIFCRAAKGSTGPATAGPGATTGPPPGTTLQETFRDECGSSDWPLALAAGVVDRVGGRRDRRGSVAATSTCLRRVPAGSRRRPVPSRWDQTIRGSELFGRVSAPVATTRATVSRPRRPKAVRPLRPGGLVPGLCPSVSRLAPGHVGPRGSRDESLTASVPLDRVRTVPLPAHEARASRGRAARLQ